MSEQAWRVLSRLSWQKVVEIAVLTIFFFLLLVVITVVDRTGAFGYSGFNFRIEHVVIAAVPAYYFLLILGYLEEIQGPMGFRYPFRTKLPVQLNHNLAIRA